MFRKAGRCFYGTGSVVRYVNNIKIHIRRQTERGFFISFRQAYFPGKFTYCVEKELMLNAADKESDNHTQKDLRPLLEDFNFTLNTGTGR